MVAGSKVSCCHISMSLTAVLGRKLQPASQGCSRYQVQARSALHCPGARGAAPVAPARITNSKFFFTTGFTTAGTGTEVSSLTVKDTIQKMVREEDAAAPLKDQQIVDALRSRKPDLAETKTYVDPPRWGPSGGHAFSRRVDANTLQRVESPDQIDSWNRTWTFFEWVLRPYEDRSKPVSYVDQAPRRGGQ